MSTDWSSALLNKKALCLLFCLFLAACSSNKAGVSNATKGSYSGSTYTVKRGDTLYRISRMTGSSVGELARLNGLSPPYTIEVGQRLRVKSSASAGASRTASRSTTASRRPATLPKVDAPPPGQRCWRWPTSGKVVLGYSTADGGNKGIDIAGQRGQPIYASAAGRVVYVGNQLRGYGNLIMIKHTEDYITAYAHNDTTLVNNGQQVKAGQKIATMGSTGTDSVKLHFQIRYRATALDPQRYLPPQGRSPSC
ncbi:peptidoglycan DD-metalloendopeptidase family protein [Franconibacter sp. IITDAS19]|uniref:amidase activator ActS n=1 Tax=Franconibacter sp. IITDAS19 TaxID=2930569 RepID=UPI001FF77B26|nr:amidase activator ActS [Franconibacter sp. IITDAS19]MCK1969023.1 peptidoglycan DD-metalloendopeptidase family protein [Franconibacter sp. IITDAS19]